MVHTRDKKRPKSIRLTKPLRVLVSVFLFGAVGVYFLLISYAESPELANTYGSPVNIEAGLGAASTENIPLGTVIAPSRTFIDSSGGRQPLPHPTAIVSSTYYSSRYLQLTGISCDPNVRCISVTWPNFDNDPPPGTFMPTQFDGQSSPGSMDDFAFDHKFSICTDSIPSIESPQVGMDSPLYTPRFVVTGNNKRFVITTLIRYYLGGNCAVSGGQTDRWYKTMRESGAYICYNGNGTLDGPYYDGSRNSCFDPGNRLPGGNDTVIITGGETTSSGDQGDGNGNGNSPAPGPGNGGGGGSSAVTVDDKDSSTPTETNQGEADQPKIEPSPFFDGRVFTAGSSASGATDTISINGRTSSYMWLFIIGVLVILAVGGWFGWRKLDPKLKSRIRAKLRI